MRVQPAPTTPLAPLRPGHRQVADIGIAQLTQAAGRDAGAGAGGPMPAGTGAEFFVLTIQRRGQANLQQDARTACLAPGDMALATSARACLRDFGHDCRQTVLTIPAAALRAACPGADTLTATAFSSAQPLVALMALMADSHFDTPYPDLPAPVATLAANAIVATLAVCLQSVPTAAAAPRRAMAHFHLKRIRQYALAHLGDTELSVAKVAQALAMSPTHVHRLFAAEAQTFSVWLWDSRLQACHQALGQPAYASLSIGQLAFRFGYLHAAHFSRVYRASFGMTARAWRAAQSAPAAPSASGATNPTAAEQRDRRPSQRATAQLPR